MFLGGNLEDCDSCRKRFFLIKDFDAHLILMFELTDMSFVSHHVHLPRLAVTRRVQLFEDDRFETGP